MHKITVTIMPLRAGDRTNQIHTKTHKQKPNHKTKKYRTQSNQSPEQMDHSSSWKVIIPQSSGRSLKSKGC